MKKKFVVLTMLIISVFSLVGCCRVTQETVEDNSSMFVKVEYSGHYEVVYHKTTKVMYAVSRGSYNQGTFTVLLNEDGSPMVYDDD